MYTGEFINLKYVLEPLMTSTDYEQLFTENQYILKAFVLQLTLSQGHNSMDFLWLITPGNNIFLFFCLFVRYF